MSHSIFFHQFNTKYTNRSDIPDAWLQEHELDKETIEEIEKGEFPHFMLKEIHDQKHSISDTLRGRLNLDDGTSMLGGINDHIPSVLSASRIYITACGTSWHAGLIGKHLIANLLNENYLINTCGEYKWASEKSVENGWKRIVPRVFGRLCQKTKALVEVGERLTQIQIPSYGWIVWLRRVGLPQCGRRNMVGAD